MREIQSIFFAWLTVSLFSGRLHNTDFSEFVFNFSEIIKDTLRSRSPKSRFVIQKYVITCERSSNFMSESYIYTHGRYRIKAIRLYLYPKYNNTVFGQHIKIFLIMPTMLHWSSYCQIYKDKLLHISVPMFSKCLRKRFYFICMKATKYINKFLLPSSDTLTIELVSPVSKSVILA